jgi:hypothetical protein
MCVAGGRVHTYELVDGDGKVLNNVYEIGFFVSADLIQFVYVCVCLCYEEEEVQPDQKR